MKTEKLFNVLVLGGALLGSGAAMADDLVAGPPAFCTTKEYCEPVYSCSEDAELEKNWAPKKGVNCCWGTSCANVEDGEE